MSFSLDKYPQFVRLAHFLVSVQNKYTILVATMAYLKKETTYPLERVGSLYGGWWVPASNDVATIRNVLVSAGLGFDVTFDKELARRGYFVICIEPSVESFNYSLGQLCDYENVRVINKGLSTFVGEQKFYAPGRENHDSLSVVNLTENPDLKSSYFNVTSIDQLFNEFTELDNANFRILKMDIEGGELSILENPGENFYRFDFIGVEMDFLSLIPFLKFRRRIDGIRRTRFILEKFERAGYHLIKNENFNFFWSKY